MQIQDPIEEQSETPELAEEKPELQAKPEIKETKELRMQAAQYLETPIDGSFIRTLKSFAAWLKQQLAKLD